MILHLVLGLPLVAIAISAAPAVEDLQDRNTDPCVTIAGQKWVAPSDVRACFNSFPVNETIKENILEVVSKTLAFHTNLNFEISAPEPFTQDVHENLLADLSRISSTNYASDFDLHIDLSRSVKRLQDGHCVYINDCYDSSWLTFIPLPLALLTDEHGQQAVHVTPEAFAVASVEFADEIEFWQNALPGSLKGQLASLSGAKVLEINGQDPFDAVNANAAIAGSYQGLSSRQNGFFSSSEITDSGWSYLMGQFAQLSQPITDEVTLTVQRVNSSEAQAFTIPYRSRIGTDTVSFTNGASFRANNCRAIDGTNGVDEYASSNIVEGKRSSITRVSRRKRNFTNKQGQSISRLLDDTLESDIALPNPNIPLNPVNGSTGVAQFYLLGDKVTGVLALGSFSEPDLDTFLATLLTGLQALKAQGATRLIADVSNNGGGFICAAEFLHRIIAGPKSTTVPQAGLDTMARAGPLAQLIVKQIVDNGADPDNFLLYNPLNWDFANNTPFPADLDWLSPDVPKVINGVQDAFSQRLGTECAGAFTTTPPNEALFEASQVLLVNNGRCGSSCALFTITMNKEEGARAVVVGGKQDVGQQYCGTVGGQSSDFSTMDSQVKTTHLKNNSLAPPDFLTNSVQGITWRLGFGIQNTQQPEEWQNHPADVNFPLTADIVNNPMLIWEAIAKELF